MKYTDTPDGVTKDGPSKGSRIEFSGESPEHARLTEEGQAVKLACELADARGQSPDWQVSFELARRLRSLAADSPERFKGAVTKFCERTGRPFEEFWYAVLDCWDKVRLAEGEDVFAWAVEQAAKTPYRVSPCHGSMYATVASIAYHLSRHTDPAPFWLPRERLASLLNANNLMTITRIVNLLKKNGVVRCVDESFSYRDRKAKEYVFMCDAGMNAGPE